jgi:hypothetical protein
MIIKATSHRWSLGVLILEFRNLALNITINVLDAAPSTGTQKIVIGNDSHKSVLPTPLFNANNKPVKPMNREKYKYEVSRIDMNKNRL